jgi:hypothetical protein
LSRKATVEVGITNDMRQRKYCDPEDIVRFLLALCCQDDSLPTAISHDEVLDTRFDNCLREVIPVANSIEMRRKLDN